MITNAGTTLDRDGNIVSVFDCEKHGWRSTFKPCPDCEFLIDYWNEEAEAGVI